MRRTRAYLIGCITRGAGGTVEYPMRSACSANTHPKQPTQQGSPMKTTPRRRPLLKALGEATAILGISLLVVHLCSPLPHNIDTYLPYSNLAWWYYPLNKLDPLTRYYDLALFPNFKSLMPSSSPDLLVRIWNSIPFMDTYLPLRAFAYIGSLPSLLYFPFFLAWPSPHSLRFLGLIALALQALLICRIVRYDVLKCFLILLVSMPYSLLHFTDYGPTVFPLTLIYLIVYMIGKWLKAVGDEAALGLVYPPAIGGLVFAGIWIKLSFIFYVPVIALFILCYAIEQRPRMAIPGVRGRFLRHCGILVVTAGVLTGTLLNATDRVPGGHYYQIAWRITQTALADGNYTYRITQHCADLLRLFLNPLKGASMICDVTHTVTPSGVMLCGVIITLLAYGAVRLRILKRDIRFVAVNALAFTLVLGVLISSPVAVAFHHLIMAYPFLVLALFSVFSELRGDRIVSALLVLFLALNLWQYCGLFGMDRREWVRPGTVTNYECLGEALDSHTRGYVFCHVDWGTYSIKALYGRKDQCNVWVWPVDSMETVQRVRDMCRKTGRRPMFIRMKENSSTDLEFLMRHFPGLVPMRLDCDAGAWGIWYQPPGPKAPPPGIYPPCA